MSDLPTSWTEATLDKLLSSIETGTRPKGGVDKYADGIPSIGAEHLGDNGDFRFGKIKYVPVEFARKMARGKIETGDVLLVKDGATTGKCSLVPPDFPYREAFVNEHVFVCRFSPDLDSRFFAYFLRSREGQHRVLSNFRGAAQGGITQTFAPNTRAPVAPINEQKRVAEKLESLLARVDSCQFHLERVPQILKRLRQSVLATAMAGTLSAEWRLANNHNDIIWQDTTLAEVCVNDRAITYGVIKLGNDEPNGIPCLRTSNVRWLSIDELGMKRIKPELSEAYSRTILIGNEVLVNVRGTLGGVSVVKPHMVGWNVSREVAVAPINTALALPEFIALWIASNSSQAWLTSKQKGVAYTGINIEDLRQLPVRLPSLDEQAEIVRLVERLFVYADRLEVGRQSATDRIEQLTPSLLAKAFRGELVEQDPNDEPAEILLARIISFRAAQPPKLKRKFENHDTRRTKMTEDTVKDIVRRFPRKTFSFEELREKLPGDYEPLKEILFTLLSEPEPLITQVFDQSAMAIRFVRGEK
jgi:type I restriction enzyme S subunit